jgi:glycosyltransferase involved in cell wall biosynthesis
MIAKKFADLEIYKIFHVVTSLDFGGVERHMEILGDALNNQTKFRYVIIAIGVGGAAASKLTDLGVEVICLNEVTRIPSLTALKALYQIFRREQPVIVHTHGAEANFHGLLAAFLARVPVRVGEEIGIPAHSNVAKFIFRQIYRMAHRVIGVSNVVVDWLLACREVSQKRVACLYSPVLLPAVRHGMRDDAAGRTFRVCYVGRLESVKNPLVLLDSAKNLIVRGVPVECWIVGDGSLRKEIEDRIASLGISQQVQLFGFQPDPSKFIRQCDVYVQPSLSEGFSLALIEAMGCGVPVIVTRVGGAPEVVEQGVTGWLLDDPSACALTTALHEAWLLGEQKLFNMGLNARHAVEGRFEPEQYIVRLEKLYSLVAAERGVVIA